MTEKWIDVSAHNGLIDWPKAAAAGIKGVVIRAGYGNSITQQDKQFTANMKGAIAAGLKVAVYWFSYSDSAADAMREWAVCKQIIEPYRKNILFVASDYEYDSYNYYKRLHGTAPSKTLINQMVNAFLGAVRADGYGTMLYTNNDYRKNIFTAATLGAWDIWLADYTGGPDIPCAMQQTGSSGLVSGISTRVDTNDCFEDFAKTIRADTSGKIVIPKGKYYQLRTFSSAGARIVAGNPANVVIVSRNVARDADGAEDWYLVPIGDVGSETGIYISAAGDKSGKQCCVVKIGTMNK